MGIRIVLDFSAKALKNGCPDPPGSIGAEFITFRVIKLDQGLHESKVSFLDQVEERKASIGIPLCNADHQPQIGLDQFILGLLGFMDGLLVLIKAFL